jgi:hypothetical protein
MEDLKRDDKLGNTGLTLEVGYDGVGWTELDQ